jgi:hypothetical protein
MCCGSNNARVRNGWAGSMAATIAGSASAPSRSVTTTFEYIGRTRLLVTGPVTGRQYLFDHAGVRLEIDPRDRSAIAAVPLLRPVGVMGTRKT